jgi:hypothetical protein
MPLVNYRFAEKVAATYISVTYAVHCVALWSRTILISLLWLNLPNEKAENWPKIVTVKCQSNRVCIQQCVWWKNAALQMSSIFTRNVKVRSASGLVVQGYKPQPSPGGPMRLMQIRWKSSVVNPHTLTQSHLKDYKMGKTFNSKLSLICKMHQVLWRLGLWYKPHSGSLQRCQLVWGSRTTPLCDVAAGDVAVRHRVATSRLGKEEDEERRRGKWRRGEIKFGLLALKNQQRH